VLHLRANNAWDVDRSVASLTSNNVHEFSSSFCYRTLVTYFYKIDRPKEINPPKSKVNESQIYIYIYIYIAIGMKNLVIEKCGRISTIPWYDCSPNVKL